MTVSQASKAAFLYLKVSRKINLILQCYIIQHILTVGLSKQVIYTRLIQIHNLD